MLRHNQSISHTNHLLWPFCGVSCRNVTTRNTFYLHEHLTEQTTHLSMRPRCTRDAQTKVELNGLSQRAHFSFEASRFVEHKNRTVSTFYLHCATRLCEASTCSSLLPVSKFDLFVVQHLAHSVSRFSWGQYALTPFQQDCGSSQSRRKREADDVPTNTTITSPPILVGKQTTGKISRGKKNNNKKNQLNQSFA